MTERKVYNKLVRDKIPQIIERHGKTLSVCLVDPHTLKDYAVKKLQEEIAEFIENPCAEEAADILEVLDFICYHEGIKERAIRAQKISKYATKGGFEKGYILEWVEE